MAKTKASGTPKVTFGVRKGGKHAKRQGPKESPMKAYNAQGR